MNGENAALPQNRIDTSFCHKLELMKVNMKQFLENLWVNVKH